MDLRRPAAATALALALAVHLASPPARAQGIFAVQAAPDIGSPGDVIGIHSTAVDLSTASAVVFRATVGGSLGTASISVTPSVVSADFLEVTVPAFGSFDPQGAEVLGLIDVDLGGSFIATPIQLLEATGGQSATFGQPGSELAGFQPRVGLSPFVGLPEAGQFFEARVFDLPSGALPTLAIGLPAPEPYLPFAAGELLLDLAGPLLFVTTAGPGQPAPGWAWTTFDVPASAAGATVALQWLAVDPATFTLSLSNGLRTTL